jgi:hypothetical protein
LEELEGEDEPGPGDEGDVDEPDHVTQQARHQHLNRTGQKNWILFLKDNFFRKRYL